MNLKEWASENNLKYKGAFYDQVWFMKYLAKHEDIEVVGSKSVILPIYVLTPDGLQILMRNNFHNWNLVVFSREEVKIDFKGLVDKNKDYCYLEGLEEYRELDYYKSGLKEFLLCCWDDYALFTVIWLLRNKSTS